MAHASEDANKSDAGVPPKSLFFWAEFHFHWGKLEQYAR